MTTIPAKPPITSPTMAKKDAPMSEGRIVNKYTLVPLGAVLAGVLVTATIMQWTHADKTRITILESELIGLKSNLATTTNTIETQRVMLTRIDKTVAVIAASLKLEIPGNGI